MSFGCSNFFILFVFTRLLIDWYVNFQVLEEQSIADSLRLVNFKTSLIKFALNKDFNFKLCDHDNRFSGISVSRFVRVTLA